MDERVDGLKNAYEELLSRSLREYGEKGMLDVLSGSEEREGDGVEGYEEYRKEMEEKLGRVGLSMEAVYRELWKESCGVELSEEEAMRCIKSRGVNLSTPPANAEDGFDVGVFRTTKIGGGEIH